MEGEIAGISATTVNVLKTKRLDLDDSRILSLTARIPLHVLETLLKLLINDCFSGRRLFNIEIKSIIRTLFTFVRFSSGILRRNQILILPRGLRVDVLCLVA